ncbi:MAG: CapA family protein [Epulopiscium sp.]|nr:CapA family protein [Candidatus Epulonipiscium sp.]
MKPKLIFIVVGLFMLTGCTLLKPPSASTTVDLESTSNNMDDMENITEVDIVEPKKREEPKEPERYYAQLSAVGDIMVHKWQLEGAYDTKEDNYDFSHSFEYIRPYIQQADYAIANLETTLAGIERGYQGYPRFNTPEVLAKNLKDVGFDLVTTANNHSMDSNAAGVLHTIQVLEDTGLDHVGTYKNQEDSEEIMIKEINHISFAFLSYTYGTNGIPVPKDQPYLVNTWNMYEPEGLESMYNKVREAKKLATDFVVVAVHFGNEYHSFPNHHQEEIVRQLFLAGADIVLGSHPHVLQPIDIQQIIQEDGTQKTGVVIYSLGNFISSQKPTKEDPAPKDAGIIFSFTIEKIEGKKAEIRNILFVPTWVQWIRKNNKPYHRIIAVEQALRETAEGQETGFTAYEIQKMKQVRDRTVNHMMHYLEKQPKLKNDVYYLDLEN